MISAIVQASTQASTTAPAPTQPSNTNTTNRLDQPFFIDHQQELELDQVHNTHQDPLNSQSLIDLLDNLPKKDVVELVNVRASDHVAHQSTGQDTFHMQHAGAVDYDDYEPICAGLVSDHRNDGQVKAHLKDAHHHAIAESHSQDFANTIAVAMATVACPSARCASNEPTFYAGEAQYCTTYHRDALWPI